MSNIVIRAENISKQYRLGNISTGSLAHDINRWWHRLLGNGDPYLKIGEENDRAQKGNSEYIWALKDVSFEVRQGEVLGIIGRNGAGKSTLLKLLSKVTQPTLGNIKIKGRIASLLEVGTGFHPELTGKENIFLNGAILGMTRPEIKKKFDEIVDFAGVERYIDTPVKRYSSGMYVRLAFAVAAHLEPDILIVDEVLAVGDAEFQKRCLGKMKDVSDKEGRTVLFVSHSMQSIATLTKRSVFLERGKIVGFDNTSVIIKKYLEYNIENNGYYEDNSNLNLPRIIKASIKTSEPNYTHINGEPFEIELEISLPAPLKNGALAFQILNSIDVPIVHCWIFNSEKQIFKKEGVNKIKCYIPKFRLYIGSYRFRFILADNSGNEILQTINDICSFQVEIFNRSRDYKWEPNTCTYLEDFEWKVE
jgi:lipopolysaccharide transport system ATP-binding protein